MLNFNRFKLAALVGLAAVVGTVGGSCVLSSCTKSVVEEQVGEKSHVMVDVRAFDLGFEGMSGTRADASESAERLSFAVFDSEGALVGQVIHQVSSDEGFGLVEMDLWAGDYKLVAVAHSGEADAVINSESSVVLPGTLLTDTFAKVQELTVVSGKDCSLGMTLPRLTSAFVLRLTDTPPAEAEEIEVVVNTAGLAPTSLDLNPSTGLVSKNLKQSVRIPIEDFSGDVPVYFISMLATCVVNVKATAYDSEGTEIISHSFTNVSLVPNQRTVATGCFFKSQGSGTIALGSDWDEDNELNY